MRTFLIKVTTYKNFKDEQDFAANLEDIKPWFYNRKEEAPEESDFKDIKVIKTEVIEPFGGSIND